MRLLLILLALAVGTPVLADDQEHETHPALASALAAYDAGDYARSATLFEAVLARQPDCARCTHLLGRSYGRLAQNASWGEAIALARKTRAALEQAVALEPENTEAIEDLIAYYRTAPAFLGGSEAKARELERHLSSVDSGRTS